MESLRNKESLHDTLEAREAGVLEALATCADGNGWLSLPALMAMPQCLGVRPGRGGSAPGSAAFYGTLEGLVKAGWIHRIVTDEWGTRYSLFGAEFPGVRTNPTRGKGTITVLLPAIPCPDGIPPLISPEKFPL